MKTALGVILLLAALRRASCAVVAVIVMTRHGDRTANYGNPWNFTEAIDVLTPLGSNMSYGNGALIRDMYVNQTSPTAVEGLNATFNPLQIYAQSGDNEVQLNSATAFLQGLFPPDATLSLELTNNITYKPPLSGYQYIPINTVPADSDLFLNGWTDCPNAAAQVKAAQSSPEFAAVQAAHQGYLDSLAKYLGGRPNGLAYAYDMYDLLNYQYTYDRQLFTELSAGGGGPLPLAQLRDLANYEEDTRYDRAAPGGGGGGACQVARWVRKFPLFLRDREYVVCRRVWSLRPRTFHCISRSTTHPAAPRRPNPFRVDHFRSCSFIRPVPSNRGDGAATACEIVSVHQEDSGISRQVARVGVAHGLWGFIQKMEQGIRLYQTTGRRASPLLPELLSGGGREESGEEGDVSPAAAVAGLKV